MELKCFATHAAVRLPQLARTSYSWAEAVEKARSVAKNSIAREPCANGAVLAIERSLLAAAVAAGRSYPSCARDAAIAAPKPPLARTESMPAVAGLAGLAQLRP